MAPYNGQYRTQYDPVGSQYTQQHHQNYYAPSDQQQQQQPQRSTQTPQSQQSQQPTAPAGYQAATYSAGYSGQPYYNYQSTESRAAETLSHLSAQDPPSTRAPASQYDAASRADTSSWNTSDRSATTQQQDSSSWHNTDNARRTANPSPLYQHHQGVQKPTTTAATYSPVQSYAQPQDSTNTYPYNSYSRSDQQGPQTGTAQSTAHMFPTSNFRPSSPYIARQQQKTSAQRSSISSTTSAAPRDHQQTTSTPTLPVANVGQARAPSATPSSVHQKHANAPYNRRAGQSDSDQAYSQITVDPTQVYDPWPEQQRKLAEARRKAELEEQRKAKEEAEQEAKRQAEEEAKRKVEEEKKKKLEDEARKRAEEKAAEDERRRQIWVETQRKAEEGKLRKEEERKRKADEKAKTAETLRIAREVATQEQAKRANEARQRHEMDERARQEAIHQGQPPPTIPTVPHKPRPMPDIHGTHRLVRDGVDAAYPPDGAGPPQNLETEMAAIFRKMRDLNQMDPGMFARMWENERQAHLAKAQIAQPSVPQNTPGSVPASVPARPVVDTAALAAAYPAAVRHPQPSAAHSASSQTPAVNGQGRATPVTVPASTRNPNTTWPPGKKSTLAETATKWLNERKENANKQISLEAVVDLLAPNPSYMTLCESLEQMGLHVDRAQFARALLSVVPDAAKAKPATPTLPAATAATASSTTPLATAPIPITGTVKSTAAKHNNNGKFPGQRGRPSKERLMMLQNNQPTVDLTHDAVAASSTGSASYQPAVKDEPSTVAYQSGFQFDTADDSMPDADSSYASFQPPQPTPVQRLQKQGPRQYSSPYFPRPNHTPSVARPTPPPPGPPPAPRPPPANKTEAARKRTFSELVDLSGMNSDSEDDMPPTKQANTQQYDTAASGVHYYRQPNANYNLNQYIFSGHVPLGHHPHPVPIQPAVSAQPTVLNKAMELRGQVLVEPIRREKVMRKSRYDPRTICRDVLLATGRHPDMPSLNRHLNDLQPFLKEHSLQIDLDKFDLATIRWNVIDPGEPISELEEAAEDDSASTAENQDAGTDADDEDEILQEILDTSETRPVTANPSTVESSPVPTTRAPSSAPQVVAVQVTSGPVTAGGAGSGGQKKPFPKRQVGRPRKSLPAPASAAEGKSSEKAARRVTDVQQVIQRQRATSNNAMSSNTPRPKQQTPRMSTPSGTTGYAAFRSLVPEVDENGNPIKKKGRPVGWRKSVHSKAALAAQSGDDPTPSSSSKGPDQRTRNVPAPNYAPPIQRRNRQPKATHGTAAPHRPAEAEAEFNQFKCEWEDCGSLLHNMDTLRKHVVKVHGKATAEGDYECSWLGCFADDEVTCFESMGEWMEHMENMHVKAMARKLGDGPRAGLSDPYSSEISDAYLSDSRGRLVTPKISMTPPPEGSREWLRQQQRAEAAWRITNLKGQKLEDEIMLQQLEEKRRAVGPTLMQHGSILVTDERRRNFLDDEDFSDTVSD